MERNTFDNVAWDRALTPHFAHQPAWTRVPTKPLCSASHLSTIMTRVATLTQRHQTNATASSIISHQLPSWPGAQDFFQTFSQNPREEQDAPYKKARDDTFLSSNAIHQINGQPDSRAHAVHDECQALVDVANFYLHRAEESLFPLYRSLRDGTYQAPVIGKRRRDMDEGDLEIQKNTFSTICDVMAPVLMARRDGQDEITVRSAAIAFQAYETFPQNSRYPLVFYGIPALTDVTERSEEPIPPKAPAQEPTTISLDMKSDSDIFATAPIAQSPTVLVTQARETAAESPIIPTTEAAAQSSPITTSSSDAASEAPPAAISQLAEAAGHRLDGNANVVIEEGYNGRLFVRFKISADHAPLFPRGKALDESSMVVGTPICASTPKVLPETVVEPVTPTPKAVTEAVITEAILEPSTPTPAAIPEVVAPITITTTVTTTDSTLTELTSTPIIYEDEESPSREYMRGFIQRSKRAAENNVSPTRPALAPRSPNQGSPEKIASPEKPATPEKQASPQKVSTPTRRSSRLTNKAPKSSIPTPIRIDSRSGAGRARAVAPDVAQTTRANTRKNKGRAQYPAEVLAAMGEEGEKGSSSPVALPRGGKTVRWKSPVEESAPKRVTRSRAKKIAAARA